MLRLRGVLAVVALSGLVACGGDGGGTVNTPPPDPKIAVRTAALQSAQEVPMVTALGLGSASFNVNLDTYAITGSVSSTVTNATAAHIHDGVVGTNGPVIVPLVAGANGSWSVPPSAFLTLDQVIKFQNGGLYVNIHTASNPGGEVRGQIGMLVKQARLTGAQVSPAVTTNGSGWGWMAMHLSTGELRGEVNLTGATASAVKLNVGAFGANGSAVVTLTGGPTLYTVPAGTVLAGTVSGAFQTNQLYLTAETAANPAGELRGQLDSVVKIGTLSGTQEVPANTSTATASGIVMMNPSNRTVAVAVSTSLTNATASHIHDGNSGVNGAVIVPFSSPVAGTWVSAPGATITEAQVSRFFGGGLYFNVHSAAFPGGEIRAQITANPG